MNVSSPQDDSLLPRILVGDRSVLLHGKTFLIGRHVSNDLVLDHDSVSAHHAVIKANGDVYLLTDMGSTNGCSVNGEPVNGTVILHDHDRLCFGGIETFFVVPQPKSVLPPPLPSQSGNTNRTESRFTWWPRNKIISRIMAVWLVLVFILSLGGTPLGALFTVGIFYGPMTFVRYLRYRHRHKGEDQHVHKPQPSAFWWLKPLLGGLVVISIFLLLLVGIASSESNSQRQQVMNYKAANAEALNEHNSLSNIIDVGVKSGIHAYYGDFISPLAEVNSHYETSAALKSNIAAADAYDAQLTAQQSGDGGIVVLALLLLVPALLYVIWKLFSWSRALFTALAFMLVLSSGIAPAQTPALSLDNGWLGSVNAGATAAKELGALLSPFASPSANLDADASLEIYRGVTYLMPLNEARAKLGLPPGGMVSKVKVITGGFPRDSIFYYAFDGVFDGGYNKLHLLTDKADQVVAVQLVCESPRRDMSKEFYNATDWSFYNFVCNRRKATSKIWADHTTYFLYSFSSSTTWREYSPRGSYGQPSGNQRLIRIDSVLFDPDLTHYGHRGKDWKFLEISQLYLPKPMMETMLHCITQSGTR